MYTTRRAFLITLALFSASICIAETNRSQLAFWQNVKEGEFQSAIDSVRSSLPDSAYNEIVGILYSMLGDQKMFRIYRFRYAVSTKGQNLDSLLQQASGSYASANVNSVIGVLYWEMGDRDRSASYLKKALAQDPKNPFALNYFSMQYYEKASRKYLDYALKAIEQKPDYSEAYNNAAVAYAALGQKAKAYQLLKDCVAKSIRPHPNTYFNILMQVGQSGVQIKDRRNQYTIEEGTVVDDHNLDDIHNLLRNHPTEYRDMLDACLREAMYGETQYLLKKIEAEKIAIPTNFYWANVVFLTNNDRDYDRFVQQSVGKENLTYVDLYILAQNYFRLGSFNKAIGLYQKALLVLDPEDSEYAMQTESDLGAAYMSQKDFNRGIPLLKKALEIAPRDFITLVNLGRGFRDKGDKQEARKYLQAAIESAQSDEEKAQAKRFLDSVR